MDIWFYHLTRQPLDRALPMLLERSIERGWKAVVQLRSEERLAALDEALWTYSEESFLGHGTAKDGDADLQHVYLTTGAENPNAAQIRFFVEGAQVTAVIERDSAYERIIVMFDGNDPEELDTARAQWKSLRGQGHSLAYWQQSETGWEKKA